MKIWGRTQPVSEMPIEKVLSSLKSAGFEGVEICLENPDIAPGSLTEKRAGEIREKLKETGFPNYSVSYHKNYIYDDRELELSLKAIRLVPHFGTEIFVFAGGWPKDESKEDAWPRLIERTIPLVETAEKHKVTLAIEFEPGFVCGSTNDLHRLFTDIPSDNLKANLDIGHVFLCDDNPLDAIRSLRGKIAHAHVENMASQVHKHLLPWEGDMVLPQYFDALSEAHFDGGIALDLYKMDYLAVAPRCIEYLKQCISA